MSGQGASCHPGRHSLGGLSPSVPSVTTSSATGGQAEKTLSSCLVVDRVLLPARPSGASVMSKLLLLLLGSYQPEASPRVHHQPGAGSKEARKQAIAARGSLQQTTYLPLKGRGRGMMKGCCEKPRSTKQSQNRAGAENPSPARPGQARQFSSRDAPLPRLVSHSTGEGR